MITDPSADAGEQASRHGDAARMAGHAVVHSLGYAASLAVTFALVPLFLRHVPTDLYGTWLVSIAASAAAGSLTVAVWWTTTRVVSSSSGDTRREFLAAVALLTCGIGLAGGTLLALAGWWGPPVWDVVSPAGHVVLMLVGPLFLFDQLAACATAVLGGLQCFARLNLSVTAVNVVRGAVLALALSQGAGIVAVALVHVLGTAAMAMVLWTMALRVLGGAPLPVTRSFSALRGHLRFASQLLLVFIIGAGTVQLMPIAMARVLGPAAVVAFYLGARVPQALSSVAQRIGEAAFPTLVQAAERPGASDLRYLVTGATRWMAVCVLPACIVLVFAAPTLLHLWLGTFSAATLLVFRLLAATLLLEAVTLPASVSLTAWGRTDVVMLLDLCSCLVLIVTFVATLRGVGVGAAALALLASHATSGLVHFIALHRLGMVPLRVIAREVVRPLLLPAMASTALCAGVLALPGEPSVVAMAALCVAAPALFLGLFLGISATDEERLAVWRRTSRLVAAHRRERA